MIKEELLVMLAAKRAEKITLTWAQFAAAVAALPDEDKNKMMLWVNKGDVDSMKRLSATLLSVVTQRKAAIARADVDARAADDSFSIAELLTLLG